MHLRTNETETERAAAAPVREEQQDRSVERAADTRALTAVGAGPGAVASMDAGAARSLQRMAGNAAVATALQRKAGPADLESIDGSNVGGALAKSGSSLSDATQDKMSASFGVDRSALSSVQLVRDDASTTETNSAAYTSGDKVVVPSSFDEHSESGQSTLGHELTHVFQQRSTDVGGTEAAGGIKVSDPNDSFEREAHANGDRIAQGGAAEVASAGISATSVQTSRVQRSAPEEEEKVQQLRLQRQAAGPEEEEKIQQLRVQREESETPPEEEEEKPA